MSDRETPSRGIGAVFTGIFGGLLVLFGGGCVVVWVFVYAGLVTGADPYVSNPLGFLAEFLPLIALGLASLVLGVALLRRGLRHSRKDNRKH